jgi:predicted RNA-binding protein Jag
MNPYERRVVHMTVRELPGLTTVSEGDGFLKRIRVERLAP